MFAESMFGEIYRFELRYQLRQPLFWVAGLIFFLITFLAVTTDAVVLGGSIGQIHRNAPYVVMQMLLVMSLLGVFVTTAFVAGTVIRDQEHGTRELFFSTPMKKRDYLLGRFLGALTVAIGIYLPVVLGIFLGARMPWIEAERVGPFAGGAYLFSFLILALPNTLLSSAAFFGIATRTRSLLYTYAGVVGFFVAYLIAGNLLSDIENEGLAAVIDPFGGAAFGITTKYWTVAERNTQLLDFSGPLLTNRLLWLGVALVLFVWTYLRFSFDVEERSWLRKWKTRREQKKAQKRGEDGEALAPVAAALRFRTAERPRVTPRFGGTTVGRQLFHQTRFEIRAVVRSFAFPILLAWGVLNMIGNSGVIDQLFGTPVYPVTHLMISIFQSASLFLFLVITVYTAEVVWRERGLQLDEVHDSLPVPTWAVWSSKLTAMGFIVMALLVVGIGTGIGIQAWRGYFHFELGLYLQGMLLVVGIPYVLASVLGIFFQAVGNHKYLGILLMILFFIVRLALPAWDFDHRLYQYAGFVSSPYSDMNGYGHFVQPLFWYYLYWSILGVILCVAIHLFWVRGKAGGFKNRLRIARQRFTRPVVATLAAAVVAAVATGGWIFYNTNVVNEYIPGDLQEERQAQWEKQYKQYEDLPQPRITSVYADVDIFPEDRRVDIRGRYTLRNKEEVPVDSLHLVLDPIVERREISIPGAEPTHEDTTLGYYMWQFDRPLAPGEELDISFDLGVHHEGFVNNNADRRLVANGSFFNSFDFFPAIGYQRGRELNDPNDRRKQGLEPLQRMPKIDDENARAGNYLTRQSDWLDFETVVSTSPDQIALAPGYLQREWTENGRRYFHYKMDAPILGFWAYLSADWKVEKDRWNDVAIEVYYHPDHPYNVARMIDAVKKSLDYFTREFGPYQHRQVRIVEFPRYARFAQSFPNTIPFSESIGFIARLDEDDEEPIDYVFYVTAHEVAHQWWAHQVIGANVQGATVLSETMSQYSALMVMEEEYGADQMRRFLKYEMDNYLSSRGGELLEELPLMLVENQGYIHYRKGSVVMYALKDYVGEENLNDAIRRYAEQVRFQEPPYTTTKEFLSYLEETVPPRYAGLLDDLFRDITLYENRVEEATWHRREDGKYLVRLEVDAQKLRADGEGAETEVPMDTWVDVAVFGEESEGAPPEGAVLAMEKHRVTGPGVIEMVVDEEPRRAGIDPYNKLIDRNPENNVVKVSEGEDGAAAPERETVIGELPG